MEKFKVSIIIVCVILILPIFIISIYNRPSADDYDYSIQTHNIVENNGSIFELIKAAWDTNIDFYNSWQGLYSSAFILAFQPAIYGVKYYALTPLIVIGISFMCLLAFTHVINKHFIKKSKLFPIVSATVILTIFISWLPSAVQGLFWYNGAMNYMPFTFFTILNIAILIEIYYNDTSLKRNVLLCTSMILAFIISGGNHVSAFANILLLLFVTIYLATKKKFYPIFPLVIAIIGFIIMYLAPGTQMRQNLLEQQGVIKTVLATARHVISISREWFSITWILSLIMITPISIEIAQKNKEKISGYFPFAFMIVAIIIICGMFAVPYFAMGGFGDYRVTNVIWITFMMLSWSVYTMIWGFLIKNDIVCSINEQKHKDMSKVFITIVCLIAIVSVKDGGKNSNIYEAVVELTNGVAKQYCSEMDERIIKYEDKSLTEVGVEPLNVRSKLLFFGEITSDPNIWPNTSISKYYSKKIYLQE